MVAARRARGTWRALPIGAAESQSRDQHARRLDTLWRLAASDVPDDQAFLRALLDEGARVLREGIPFVGVLLHVEDGELIVDVADADAIGNDVPFAGDRFPLAETVAAEVLRRGTTSSWTDIHAERRFAGNRRLQSVAWHAFIATPFRVGARQHLISFLGPTALREPFRAEDHAYVEMLASLCANRLQHRDQADRLRYHTEHDTLTGLLNRPSFRARGFAAAAANRPYAVVVADIERFREINDTLGHQSGDAILASIAASLSRIAGTRDTVARLGGDTFGLLLAEVADRTAVEDRVAVYAAAFARPGTRADRIPRVALSAKFGIAMAPEDGTGFEQLLARADAALYAAKEARRASWAFFERRMEDAFANARRLQHELAEAIEQEQFVLYFQPHIEFATGRVAGAEALIRWQHPQRGLVAPMEFIPFAEQHGLAADIGAWVMRETVRRSMAWRQTDPDLRVWFNLSAEEFTDPLTLLRLCELGDEMIGIGVEITESAAMRDVERARAAIEGFRAAGVCVALDDFGTGYSSLAHLRHLPFDVVKIDRAFTAGLPSDEHDIAIVEAVVTIAARYGFETIAEGVENLEQVAFLAALGCTYGQGFTYARPMPAEAFGAWLADRSVLMRASGAA